MKNTLTDDIYWASKPPEIRQLRAGGDSNATPADREAIAVKLLRTGAVIDTEIMILGWSASIVMHQREAFGYTWYPAFGQPVPSIAPTLDVPDQPSYDASKPPAGSIKVSTNADDYDAYDRPFVEAPSDGSKKVGPPIYPGSTIYDAVKGDSSPDGYRVTQDGKQFIKHVWQTPFGAMTKWELVG